jgi:hypothetical protein
MPVDRIHALIRDLQKEHAQDARRNELRGLLRSNSRAVAAINRSSGHKPITERTVQSWLIERHRVSHRPCPEWALLALRQHVVQMSPSEVDVLRNEAARRLDRPVQLRVAETHVVDYATCDIEWKKQIDDKWREHASPGLAKAMAAHESYVLGFMHGQNKILSALASSLRMSATFDEFKLTFVERDDMNSSIEYQMGEVRRDIENGSGEFSDRMDDE